MSTSICLSNLCWSSCRKFLVDVHFISNTPQYVFIKKWKLYLTKCFTSINKTLVSHFNAYIINYWSKLKINSNVKECNKSVRLKSTLYLICKIVYIQNKIIRNIKLIDVLKNILYYISINDVTYKRVFITNIKFCCQPFALIIITWQVKKIKSPFGDSYNETGIMCVHYSVKHFKISS